MVCLESPIFHRPGTKNVPSRKQEPAFVFVEYSRERMGVLAVFASLTRPGQWQTPESETFNSLRVSIETIDHSVQSLRKTPFLVARPKHLRSAPASRQHMPRLNSRTCQTLVLALPSRPTVALATCSPPAHDSNVPLTASASRSHRRRLATAQAFVGDGCTSDLRSAPS